MASMPAGTAFWKVGQVGLYPTPSQKLPAPQSLPMDSTLKPLFFRIEPSVGHPTHLVAEVVAHKNPLLPASI